MSDSDLGEIRTVLPIVRSAEQARVVFTVVSLENYDSASLLHLQMITDNREIPLPEFRGPYGPEPVLSVSDAVGAYAVRLHQAGGSRTEWRFQYRIEPTLRGSARFINVRIDAVRLRLTDEREEVWSGPWDFHVALPAATAP